MVPPACCEFSTVSPTEIVTELGETLRQSPLGIALTGDTTGYTGPDPQQSRCLLVYTAVPGSESHQKLRLLSVIGTQRDRFDP